MCGDRRMTEIWIVTIMIVAFISLAWWNTKGIDLMTYGPNGKKMSDISQNSLCKENVGPTLAQSVDARSKMMNQKKDTYAMSAAEKNFREYMTNGNRSCLTWNGNLLDGASLPLRADADYLKAKGVILIPKTPIDGQSFGICVPQMAKTQKG